MKRVRVTVTQEDIDRGQPLTTWACPIARALRRVGYEDVTVMRNYWSTETLSGDMTAASSRFIARFDDGKPVKPATFLLPVSE